MNNNKTQDYKNIKNLCGIDEAGRGPLAGPLVVAGVMFKDKENKLKNGYISKLKDSKKLNEKERESLFAKITKNSFYKIVFIDNIKIDEKGLSWCIKDAINQIMEHIIIKAKDITFLFDGNQTYNIKNLQCKIKADNSVAEVMGASILAKVSRDNFMINLHNNDKENKYKKYNFLKHKGYGTKKHILAIKKYSLSDIHRVSFKIKNI